MDAICAAGQHDRYLHQEHGFYSSLAAALGANPARTVFRHLIPNSIAPSIVLMARDVGSVVILQATLTFIRLGGDSPWGEMLSIGRNWIISPGGGIFAYWWVFVPATLAIMLFGIAWNLIGDGLIELFDPRSILMNLSDHLAASLTSDMLALIRLVKVDAEALGYPLYIIGGSVRDLLLDSTIKDFDLTVEGDAIKLAQFTCETARRQGDSTYQIWNRQMVPAQRLDDRIVRCA